MADYHIAQMNLARLNAPTDAPHMKDFVDNLERINRLGDETAGFVWRLKNDEGHSLDVQLYDDPLLVVNFTVWESIESLWDYTYQSGHLEFFRRRREWFDKLDYPYLVLWWIPAGHTPTVQEAKEKLEYLQAHGPSPLAFTFKQRFTAEEFLAAQDRA